MAVCPECGIERDLDSFTNGRHICFRCHVSTVGFKYTYGRDSFHGPTGREFAEREKALFRKRMGYDCEPVPQRAELI